MHHLITIAGLLALLSTGCMVSRNTSPDVSAAARISRQSKQAVDTEFRAKGVSKYNLKDGLSVADQSVEAAEATGLVIKQSSRNIVQVNYEDDQALDRELEAIASIDNELPSPDATPPGSTFRENAGDTNLLANVEALKRDSGVYSLEQLTSLTEQEHPRLRVATSEIEAVMGERVQAGLYPNPRMETNNPEIWAGRDSQVNFGWQQDFITKGKMRLDKAAADQKLRVAESKFVIEKMRILTELRIQYVQALAARERLRNSEDILTIAKSARDVAVELMENGEHTLTDVLLLKNQYERARIAVENNRTNFEAEIRQVAIATGIPELVVTDVSGTIDDRPPYYDEPYIREFMQSNSAHMIMARAEVVRRKILLNRAEVEPYPDFRFGPHYAASTTQGSDRQFWFTFVFDIPIWNLNQGNIRSAKAEVAGAQANVDHRRNDLLSELAEIHARHKTSQLFLARIESSILPNAEHTQRLVQDGYSKGLLDVNRLLEAQRALLEAKQDQINAYEQAWRTAAVLAGYLQFDQFP